MYFIGIICSTIFVGTQTKVLEISHVIKQASRQYRRHLENKRLEHSCTQNGYFLIACRAAGDFFVGNTKDRQYSNSFNLSLTAMVRLFLFADRPECSICVCIKTHVFLRVPNNWKPLRTKLELLDLKRAKYSDNLLAVNQIIFVAIKKVCVLPMADVFLEIHFENCLSPSSIETEILNF